MQSDVISFVNTISVTRTVLLQVSRDQFGHFLLVGSDFNEHCIFIVISCLSVVFILFLVCSWLPFWRNKRLLLLVLFTLVPNDLY